MFRGAVCTASVITPRLLLTAAHCTEEYTKYGVSETLIIRLGAAFMGPDVNDAPTARFADFKPHPGYNGIDGPSDTVSFTVKTRAAMGVEILEPLDGSAHGRSVRVELRSTGLSIVPLGPLVDGEGHFFLRIDRECPGPDVKVPRDGATWDLTQGQSSMLLDLDYGWRDICAGIANNHDDVLPGNARVRVLIGY